MPSSRTTIATVRKSRALSQSLLCLGFAAAPWIVMLGFGGLEHALTYRGWLVSALISPIVAYAGLVWIIRAFANESAVLSVDDTHVHSSFFTSRKRSDLKRAYIAAAPVFLRGPTQFMVLDFGASSKRVSLQSIVEPADIVEARLAEI